MPDQKSEDALPQPSKTIRLEDIKSRTVNKAGPSATPAIKPVKVILALPSRPAPEPVDFVPTPKASVAIPKIAKPTKALSAPIAPATAPVPGNLAGRAKSRPNASQKAPTSPTSAGAGGKVPEPAPRKATNPSDSLTAATLPYAVGELFALNNFEVEYGKKIHGAEVDIVATPKGGAFGSTIYLEVTVQYVDNTKYGKDLTKFMLVREKDRNCLCVCVSTSGFTPDVRERAEPSGITLRTYADLFSQFEKFSTYVDAVLTNQDVSTLAQTYEEPFFRDERGEHLAPAWLHEWKLDPNPASNWLVVLGEYGTGKTALTLKLQYDWLTNYKNAPHNPIPIRIELRNFVRQFDARSLLHHFLDSNQLGHIPVDFLLHLIRSRRVVLLLDGYDEMAQFLNARERGACLAALAELAGQGAKGILTSRPNYFTESEELHVFDALYASLRAMEEFWAKRPPQGLGYYFSAAFDLLRTRPDGLRASLSALMRATEGRLEFNEIFLKELEFTAPELGSASQFICPGSSLTDVIFRGLDMTGSNFEGATFDRCSFVDCKLNSSNFRSSFLFECNFNRVEVEYCDFSLIDNDSNIVAASADGQPILLSGRGAVGFFRYHGAKTDEVSTYYELQHHPRFPIVQKVCERVSEQRNSQLRGLTQRGAAQVDPPFARDFMDCLVKAGLVEIDGNNLVSATTDARRDLPRLLAHDELPDAIATFLRERR